MADEIHVETGTLEVEKRLALVALKVSPRMQ